MLMKQKPSTVLTFIVIFALQEGVMKFISILAEYGITATPRTRRGNLIDTLVEHVYLGCSVPCCL